MTKYAAFLDIDGVFTSTRAHLAMNRQEGEMWSHFDPVAIAFLNRLDETYDIDWVLMTTWVDGLNNSDTTVYHWVTSSFRNAGFRGYFPFPGWKVNPSNRPEKWNDTRANWVSEYLAANRLTYDDFIIFDDSDYKFNEILGKKRFIRTDANEGMLSKHMRNALSIVGEWETK